MALLPLLERPSTMFTLSIITNSKSSIGLEVGNVDLSRYNLYVLYPVKNSNLLGKFSCTACSPPVAIKILEFDKCSFYVLEAICLLELDKSRLIK